MDLGNGNSYLDELPIEVQQWLCTNIFDSDGNLVHIQNGTLQLVYPHKRCQRTYTNLPKKYIHMIHSPQIRLLWGRIIENMTHISTQQYIHKENRIIHYYRHKPFWPTYMNQEKYESDKTFFLNLIAHLCSHKHQDMLWLLHYSAFLAQKKSYAERTERILILYSLQQGVGKSIFANILRRIVNGSSIHASTLLNKFDAHRLGLKNLILIEEGESLTTDHYNMLKALVTASSLETTIKHKMQEREIPTSCEVIITTNKIPPVFRTGTNRREVLIECTSRPDDSFFEPVRDFDISLFANIDGYLQTIELNKPLVQKYIQKSTLDIEHVNNDIHNFIKDLLQSKIMPVYDDTFSGADYALTSWEEEYKPTGLTTHQFFKLFQLYQTHMNSKSDFRYRTFIEESHRILRTALKIDEATNRVSLGQYSIAKSHCESIFIKISFWPQKIEFITYKHWLDHL